MYTKKERAELADICYMTVEKECSKPIKEIHTELVDAGLDLANKLLNIQPLSEDEVSSAKKTVITMALRHRRARKIRIIAAVLAILVALVTTACALSDWLVGIFGIENLYRVPPGYSATVEQHEMETPSDIINFDSIDELVEYIDEPIYLPVGLSEEYVLSFVSIYQGENRELEIIWTKDDHEIAFIITFNPPYFHKDQFESYEYEYLSKVGHPFGLLYFDSYRQAIGWIDNNEYIISANDEETLKYIIDKIIYIE